MLARDEPYVLFLDELNASSPEVQKAFYSLIHERQVGEYTLPEGSVIVAAGNRAEDNALVRPVSFCDAVAYDEGYMALEAIAGRVRVLGRGGTVLQPGIGLLERAKDFPKDGPILVITDGYCDALQIRRDHAFLLPKGRALPFKPRGPVFRIE